MTTVIKLTETAMHNQTLYSYWSEDTLVAQIFDDKLCQAMLEYYCKQGGVTVTDAAGNVIVGDVGQLAP